MTLGDDVPREELIRIIVEQAAHIERLEKELEQLKGGGPRSDGKSAVPSFVKPNAPKRKVAPAPRKKRAKGAARRREAPTRVERHVAANCSHCGRRLSGGWLHASRQIIELPSAPVEIVEHQFYARHCGVCRRRELARPDLSCVAGGQSRLGVRLMSFIGYLDAVGRMTVRGIQHLLKTVYDLSVSVGEIVRVLHTLARIGQSTYDGLVEAVRGSPVVHADETGQRENGQNGYVWSLSTPDIRVYHRDPSRGSIVIQRLLGYEPTGRSLLRARQARDRVRSEGRKVFRGTLVSDFYSAYGWYLRSRQCCLTHLDRDLDELAEAHADEPAVVAWVERVLNLVERAKAYVAAHADDPPQARLTAKRAFVREAVMLARPYRNSGLPQQTLARRILQHRSRLFVFVSHSGVPPDNNAAERAIRPFVMLRKATGGTRSETGSRTQCVLFSLFSTWHLRGCDPLRECQTLLQQHVRPQPT